MVTKRQILFNFCWHSIVKIYGKYFQNLFSIDLIIRVLLRNTKIVITWKSDFGQMNFGFVWIFLIPLDSWSVCHILYMICPVYIHIYIGTLNLHWQLHYSSYVKFRNGRDILAKGLQMPYSVLFNHLLRQTCRSSLIFCVISQVCTGGDFVFVRHKLWFVTGWITLSYRRSTRERCSFVCIEYKENYISMNRAINIA